MRVPRWIVGLMALAFAVGFVGMLPALADTIVIGGQCDRTGPTKPVGLVMCPGVNDYVKLINEKGGVCEKNGTCHDIKYMEIEHEYKVHRGVIAYEQIKKAGGVATLDYGTPIVYALTPRHLEDCIPGITPGFGRADAADGERFPYIFPMAASYWSQGAAAMKYIKDQGATKGDKVAYIFYDNPAGREPLPVVRAICKLEGYTCQEFAVPAPGIEVRGPIKRIVNKKFKWVVSHLFAKSPGLAIKEFKKRKFPMDHIISLVWGAGEPDMDTAGWDKAEGYLGMHFAGVGRDFPVIQDILKMYENNKPGHYKHIGSVYYNRGVFNAAVMVEGVRKAIELHGMPVRGWKVRSGYEHMKDFDLGGFLPPLNVTTADHEGGGWVQLYQTKGGKFVKHTEWFQGYRDVVQEQLRLASMKKEVQKATAGKDVQSTPSKQCKPR